MHTLLIHSTWLWQNINTCYSMVLNYRILSILDAGIESQDAFKKWQGHMHNQRENWQNSQLYLIKIYITTNNTKQATLHMSQ